MLKQLDHIPSGLLDLPATQLEAVLGGPTLIHLDGRRPEPLLVSVLMHGNETTGWEAVRRLLPHYLTGEAELPRALSLFIGNVSARSAPVVLTAGLQSDLARVRGRGYPGAHADASSA